mgnify:CR=1 FL=1
MSIVNRVAESGLIQFDPATLVKDAKVTVVSLSSFLNEDKILREKPFRQAIAAHDWTVYKGQYVGLHIAEDTLVPQWAAMLMTCHLQSHTAGVCLGDQDAATALAYESALTTLKIEDYKQKNIIIKGCSDKTVPEDAYVQLINKLQPVVKSLFYGEACSSVPLFKKKK